MYHIYMITVTSKPLDAGSDIHALASSASNLSNTGAPKPLGTFLAITSTTPPILFPVRLIIYYQYNYNFYYVLIINITIIDIIIIVIIINIIIIFIVYLLSNYNCYYIINYFKLPNLINTINHFLSNINVRTSYNRRLYLQLI